MLTEALGTTASLWSAHPSPITDDIAITIIILSLIKSSLRPTQNSHRKRTTERARDYDEELEKTAGFEGKEYSEVSKGALFTSQAKLKITTGKERKGKKEGRNEGRSEQGRAFCFQICEVGGLAITHKKT
jgi:hypothetical protein